MIGPLNIVLVIIFLVLVPFILGLLCERVFDSKGNNLMFSRCFAMGLSVMLAAFQIPAVPMIFISASFDTLMYAYVAIIVILVALSLWLNRKTLAFGVNMAISNIKNDFRSLDKMYKVIAGIALLCIVFQSSLLIFRMHIDTDDCRFLAEALEAVEKNTMLKLHPITGEYLDVPVGEMRKEITSPYPFLLSVLSVLTRIHVTKLAHSVLPALLVPLGYASLYLLGSLIFKDVKKRVTFMFILSFTMMFSFESIYALGYTLLTIIWQGRSIFSVILLPLLWYIYANIYTRENDSVWMYVMAIVVGVASACLSGMGAVMVPFLGAAFAFAYVVSNKKLIPAILIGITSLSAGSFTVIKFIADKIAG